MEQRQDKITILPICFSCLHFINDGKYNCMAFPEGIPDEILAGDADHDKPLPQQENDIVFEEKK